MNILQRIEDIIWEIATFLDYRELGKYSLINSTWYKICTSNSLWKLVCANLNLTYPSGEYSIKEWFIRENLFVAENLKTSKRIHFFNFISINELKQRLYGHQKVTIYYNLKQLSDQKRIGDYISQNGCVIICKVTFQDVRYDFWWICKFKEE